MTNRLKVKHKIAIVGGCGHVGLPLGVTLALAGMETVLIDINEQAVQTVMQGKFPFLEKNGDQRLQAALKAGLGATTDPQAASTADVIVFVTGTPVDEHLNPKLSEVLKIFDIYQQYFRDNALVIMRSTLFPGTMDHLHERAQERNLNIRLAFCPERVAQGFALEEIDSLPQIVSAFDDESFELAYDVFSRIAPSVIRLTPLEAEMAKLMTNAWRYLEFAIANQFYLIAEKNGIDFYRLYDAIRYEYPRAKAFRAPGLTAGPCLFKDTMQLASFFDHQFYLGHSAMLVNEGLAAFVVQRATKHFEGNLWGKTVGLLGMAFKANSDDVRESLSFKVKKGLEFAGATVVYNDPYLPDSLSVNEVVDRSDLLVLCCTHDEYKALKLEKPVIDIWGFYRDRLPEIRRGTIGEERKRAANL